jgi:hypothetical protein
MKEQEKFTLMNEQEKFMTFTAKKLEACVQIALTNNNILELTDAEYYWHMDSQASYLVASLRKKVLANGIETVCFECSYPKDWWEAFKERWFPKFLLNRYPVEYEIKTFKREVYTRICPHQSVTPRTSHFHFLEGLPEVEDLGETNE